MPMGGWRLCSGIAPERQIAVPRAKTLVSALRVHLRTPIPAGAVLADARNRIQLGTPPTGFRDDYLVSGVFFSVSNGSEPYAARGGSASSPTSRRNRASSACSSRTVSAYAGSL